jgi:hypothetical protein
MVTQRLDSALYRDASAALAERADTLSSRALEVTVPVYQLNRIHRPESIATCVLLAIGQAKFLVTAGHVLDAMLKRDSAVGFRGSLLPVVGVPTRLRTPGSTAPKQDRFDVGFVRLAGLSWDSTTLSEFLSLDEVALRLPLAPHDSFAIIGYPVTKQPRAHTNSRLESWAFRLAAKGRPRPSYDALGYDPRVNLLLGFDKRQVWGAAGGRRSICASLGLCEPRDAQAGAACRPRRCASASTAFNSSATSRARSLLDAR